MAIKLAMSADQEAKVRELARQRDRLAVEALLQQAIAPTAEALVADLAPESAKAKLEHLLACIYAEYSTLNETGPAKLPVTREEIYHDHA